MGNVATPALVILAVPTGAGVSLSVWSAFTKPASSATPVLRPVSCGMSATGLGVDALEDDEEDPEPELEPESELPHAAAPRARVEAAAATARDLRIISTLSDR